nr:transposase [Borreliella bavariensis]
MLRVAKLHRKISNQRKDFLHKLSYYFVANDKNIVIENLSIKKVCKKECSAKVLMLWDGMSL